MLKLINFEFKLLDHSHTLRILSQPVRLLRGLPYLLPVGLNPLELCTVQARRDDECFTTDVAVTEGMLS